MVELRSSIELKLSLIEQSLQHLANQQRIGAPAADLARDIQGRLAQVGTNAAFEAELGEATAARSVSPPG